MKLRLDGYGITPVAIDVEKVQAEATKLGPDHVGLRCDVSSESDVVAVAQAIADKFGKCDVLVNNAGIGDSHLPTFEQDLAHFQKLLSIHLGGTFLLCREIGKLMVAQKQGAIVNISSVAGLGGMPRRNAYGAAKAGIVALTKSMACEWACFGVRVNAVAPGFVETALIKKLIADGRMDIDTISRRIPMGHLAKAEDIAEAVAFLASPAARYITGATLSVDGGWHAFGDFGDASQPENSA